MCGNRKRNIFSGFRGKDGQIAPRVSTLSWKSSVRCLIWTFFQSVWRITGDLQQHVAGQLSLRRESWRMRAGSGKRRGNQNNENRFSISEGNQEPPKKIFPDDFWLRRPILFLSLQTAGPRAFIGSLVTIKAHRSVMTSAAVGLFGSEGCVQFTQCSQSYSGNCWIFMPTCPLPSSGWPYQMLKKTHMRSLTPEWAFFYFRNRFGEQWVSHCQITAFFPPRSHKSWTPTKHLEHVVLPINDFIRRWPAGHSWNTVRYSCTADLLSHSKNHPNEGLNKDKVIAASHTFIGKSTVSYCTNISATLLGLRSTVETHHSMILFVRSKAWREGLRSKTTCIYLCPRTPGASVWEGSED